MENSLLKNIVLKWGGIFAGASILIFYISAITGQSANWKVWIVSFLAIITVITLSIRAYRSENGGLLSYGRGVGVGTLVGIFGGLISALFTFLYIQYGDPDLLMDMQEAMRENMGNWGLPEDQIEEAMEKQASQYTPTRFTLSAITNSAIGGLIISLIASAFLAKKEKLDGPGLH